MATTRPTTAGDDTLQFYDLFRAPAAAIQPLTAEERDVLRRVLQHTGALPTLDDVMDYLFEHTRAIFPFDRLSLAFVEEDGRRVVSRYTRADYDAVLLGEGYSEDLGEGSLATVLANGTPRIINDLQAYLAEHPASRSTRLLVKEGVRSSLTCPMVVEGRVVGFMFRSSCRTDVYSQHHVELQMALSERLSQTVEKAWRIEQLTAANRAYMEMLGFVSHELKNPVASMVTDARLLADGYLGDVDERQKDKLERLIRKGEHLLDVVREYLDLARVEGGELGVEIQAGVPFVDDVVEPALDLVRAQIDKAGMTVTSDLPQPPPRVDCDPTLLRIVLVNLLGNAVRYGRPHGEIRLRVRPTEDGVQVGVWNQGPGFTSDQRSRLFRKFSRLANSNRDHRGSTGLGLYNSWRIVRLHGGRIRAESVPGEWAEFIFEIPQPLRTEDTAEEATGASA